MNVTPESPDVTHVTDQFVSEIMPEWLKRASVEQVRTLRELAAALRTSQEQLQAALEPLKPLDEYATVALESAIADKLSLSVDLRHVQWREERRRLRLVQGELKDFTSYFVRVPALQQLMQNFKQNESFFSATALVHPADEASGETERVVSSAIDEIVQICRTVDVGAGYRAHLDTVLDAAFIADLADDRCRQLALEVEIAALKGQLEAPELEMLRRVVAGTPITHERSLRVLSGALKLLGSPLDGALAFVMRGSWQGGSSGAVASSDPVMGVVLYIPDDGLQPLRCFADLSAANRYLAENMAKPQFCEAMVRRVAIKDRAAFLTTLASRLKDPEPDLQTAVQAADKDLFTTLARAHVQRVKDDAAEIAVPTAQVDRNAAHERIEALQSAGLALLNLAALFVPVLGALLLADLVRQTLSQMCEGVADWSQGHRHEALEHFLGVAETVAVSAALVGGSTLVARSFVRSDFVDELQPVVNAQDQQRLCSASLEPYRTGVSDPGATLGTDGLLHEDGKHFWQHEGQRYQVRPMSGRSAWQLVHPERAEAWAPELEHNGEQAWLLSHERPQEWQGAKVLLGRLWPAAQALEEERISQILRVADVDEDALRGLLVERRPLPVALRDTLQRFAVDARIEALFEQLDRAVEAGIDRELFDWCVARESLADHSWADQVTHLQDEKPVLAEAMLTHFSAVATAPDDLLWLVRRDFPGLPDAYAVHLLEHASAAQRLRMHSESRIPLALGQQARQLLQEAKLVRIRESFYLSSSYREEAVEVAFSLLRRHANWPQAVNLELRDDPYGGRLLARLYPDQPGSSPASVMVHKEGRFALYDNQGTPLEQQPLDPAGLAEVLIAVLPDSNRPALGWQGDAAASHIREDLRKWLPSNRAGLLRDAGLRDAGALPSPLRRLPDGRIGYLLSGRGQGFGALLHLRDRIRALYPGFTSAEVDGYARALMARPGSAFANLLIQEQQYRRLDIALEAWIADTSVVSTLMARRRCARELRRCWRMNGEEELSSLGHVVGMRMSMIGTPVGTLPELPVDTDFSHITSLTLVGLGLDSVPAPFMRVFPRLRVLDLSNNALTTWPPLLARRARLTTLRLARNQIRVGAADVSILHALIALHDLDLSYNPLGAISLEFRRLSQLRTVNLRSTGLLTVPSGLEWCGFIESADLRDNSISSIPQVWLSAPAPMRRSLRLLGNPLPLAVTAQLRAPDAAELAIPSTVPTPDEAVRLWLVGLDEADTESRSALWSALRAEPGSEQFMEMMAELTATSDYRLARPQLAARMWGLMEQARNDSELREELFSLAGSPRTCVDSVISCFSVLEVRALVAKALLDTSGEQAETAQLRLARRLFRLERVERIAREAMTAMHVQGVTVDEIEVSLAFRTGLASELDLPGQPSSMQFGAISGVTKAQLAAAAASVRKAEQTDALVQYISERDFWVQYLEKRYADRYTSTEKPFWERLGALDEERETLTDEQYVTRANQLAQERKQARHDLALSLTRQALKDDPASN